MLKFEKGDVTAGYPMFVQQVNCQGVMGSGLAKQIKEQYPRVYYDYKYLCNQFSAETSSLLGHIQLIPAVYGINPKVCVNFFAQDKYGRDKRHTDYKAFQNCLDLLAERLNNYSVSGFYNTVAFPYKIGCGLAGGDWNKILKMIRDFSLKVKQDVIIVYKGE